MYDMNINIDISSIYKYGRHTYIYIYTYAHIMHDACQKTQKTVTGTMDNLPFPDPILI